MRLRRTVIFAFVLLTALSAGAEIASAQRQAMALVRTRVPVRLAPRGTAGSSVRHPAYCLDREVHFPEAANQFNRVITDPSAVIVRTGDRSHSLDEAIRRRLIALRGTGGYGVEIENLTRRELSFEVRQPTVVGDARSSYDPARLSQVQDLPDGFDSGRQRRLWSDLGQEPPRFVVAQLATGERRVSVIVAGEQTELGVVPAARVNDLIVARPESRGRAVVQTSGMSIEETRALLADLRLRSAVGGRAAQLRGQRVSPATADWPQLHVESATTRRGVSSGDRRVEIGTRIRGRAELSRPVQQLDVVTIVEWQSPPPRGFLRNVIQRLTQTVSGVFRRLLGRRTSTIADSVRDAVSAEVDALRQRYPDVSTATIWLELRGEAERVYIVRVDLRRTAQWT